MDEYAFDVLWPHLAGAILEELPVLALGREGLWGVVVEVESCGTHWDEEVELKEGII